jgi:hypothetical protein
MAKIRYITSASGIIQNFFSPMPAMVHEVAVLNMTPNSASGDPKEGTMSCAEKLLLIEAVRTVSNMGGTEGQAFDETSLVCTLMLRSGPLPSRAGVFPAHLRLLASPGDVLRQNRRGQIHRARFPYLMG